MSAESRRFWYGEKIAYCDEGVVAGDRVCSSGPIWYGTPSRSATSAVKNAANTFATTPSKPGTTEIEHPRGTDGAAPRSRMDVFARREVPHLGRDD